MPTCGPRPQASGSWAGKAEVVGGMKYREAGTNHPTLLCLQWRLGEHTDMLEASRITGNSTGAGGLWQGKLWARARLSYWLLASSL